MGCGSSISAEAQLARRSEQLKSCHQKVAEMINRTNSHPILVRLAWHDSGTYDKDCKEGFPTAGGATGSIRLKPEADHKHNAGLKVALGLLAPIKSSFPLVSHADLIQMASATAVELAGGPRIGVRFGRIDAPGPEGCAPEGNLPDAEPGPEGVFGSSSGTADTTDSSAGGHLREVFGRMGLGDAEVVALSGAHTLGRAWADRSGLGAAEGTKFTCSGHCARGDGRPEHGADGGSSWTAQWLRFDNSYFTTLSDDDADPALLKLSSDQVLFQDEGFREHATRYKESQEAFFADYAAAHRKLSELGSKFEPPEGIAIDAATWEENLKPYIMQP